MVICRVQVAMKTNYIVRGLKELELSQQYLISDVISSET